MLSCILNLRTAAVNNLEITSEAGFKNTEEPRMTSRWQVFFKCSVRQTQIGDLYSATDIAKSPKSQFSLAFIWEQSAI